MPLGQLVNFSPTAFEHGESFFKYGVGPPGYIVEGGRQEVALREADEIVAAVAGGAYDYFARIEGSSGLDKEEIERMKKQATEYAADDAKLAELVDARNTAEHLAHETEKQLKEHGERIPADERAKVEQAVSHLREVAKGDDADAIKKATEALTEASQTIGKIIYEEAAKQAAAQQAAAGAGAGAEAGAAAAGPPGNGGGEAPTDQPPKGDDVIDADFEVKESK